jgi:hypothetical protein
VAEAAPKDPERLAFVTQTTLSVDDTADIVAALQARFPAIVGPHKEDICYATTNRQEAVKAMAPKADAMLVIGRAQLVELETAGRGRRARRVRLRATGAARRRYRLARAGRRSRRRASPPGPARRRCWSTRSSTPSATGMT